MTSRLVHQMRESKSSCPVPLERQTAAPSMFPAIFRRGLRLPPANLQRADVDVISANRYQLSTP